MPVRAASPRSSGRRTPSVEALHSRYLRSGGLAETPRSDFVGMVLEAWLEESAQLRNDALVDAQIRRYRPEMIRRTAAITPQSVLETTGYRVSFGLLMFASIVSLGGELFPVKARRATSVQPVGVGVDPLHAAMQGFDEPDGVCRRGRKSDEWKFGMSSAGRHDKVESQLLWSKNERLEILVRPDPVEFMKLVDSLG